MKIENILKYAKQGLEDALEFGYNDMAVMFWEEIIKLLEKQIPKTAPNVRENGLANILFGDCPICKSCQKQYQMPHIYCCLEECGEHEFCKNCDKGIYFKKELRTE